MEIKQVRVRFSTEFYIEGVSRTDSEERNINHTYQANDIVWLNERLATVIVTLGHAEILEDQH